MKKSNKNTFYIIGAGVTGLTCAYYLKKYFPKANIIIYESNNYGGLCRSIKKEGFIYDYGGHFLWDYRYSTYYPKEFIIFLNRICLTSDIIWTKRKASIYYDKYTKITYPFQSNVEDLRKNHYKDFIECLNDISHVKETSFYKSYTHCAINMFGNTMSQKFLLPFANKFWQRDLLTMTGESFKYIPLPNFNSIFKRYRNQFSIGYPRLGGIQTFIDSLYNEVKKLGVDIKENSTINFKDIINISHKHPVIFTGNFKNLYEYIMNKSMVTFKELNAIDTRLLVLGIKKAKFFYNEEHWVYFHSDDVDFCRVNFLDAFRCNNFSIGTSLLMIEYNSKTSSKNYISDLKKIGILEKSTDILFKDEIIIPNSYVVFDIYRSYCIDEGNMNSQSLDKYISNLESSNIYCSGRYGKWSYLNSIDSMYDGYKVANRIKLKTEVG